MKRFLSIILVIVMLCCTPFPVFAVKDEATEAADTLYALGLFKGSGIDENGNPIYDLDRVPTRQEAITALVNLLGKSEEAKKGNWKIPFTDVADWAKPYVGYAYHNGLASGITATKFGGNQTVTASQYITYILRALDYEVGVDFQWDKAWEFSDTIGLTDGRYNASTDTFLRGDLAIISESALSTKLKGSNVMLMRKLYNQKIALNWAPQAKANKVFIYDLPDAIGKTTLTYEDAYALLGKDPAIIAESVKTVGDVLQYMIAAKFAHNAPGTFTPWYGNGQWGFDPPGYEQIKQNYPTCCAGYVNMALYLLDGDYEEQGVIRWLGGGNHTISYVYTNGKYYVFDLTRYATLGHYHDNDTPVTILNQLEDYYDQMPPFYPKDKITNLVALKNAEVCYPWDSDGRDNLIFPSETKDCVIQLYPKGSTSKISFKDVRIDIPMWNTDKLDLPATNIKYDSYESLKELYKGI